MKIQIELTNDEKSLLAGLPKQYKWIVRNPNGSLEMTEKEPIRKFGESWETNHGKKGLNYYIDMFQFITSNDEKPTSIEHLLKGRIIIKTQIELTDDEKSLLAGFPKQYNWIVRNPNGSLEMTEKEPIRKIDGNWETNHGKIGLNYYINMFQFITSNDEKPTSIEYLLKQIKRGK